MDEVDIDARGLICPLPVLRLRKRLQSVAVGAELTMLTDDPVAVIDVPFFCAEAGHEVVEDRAVEDARFFRVRRGGERM